MSKPAFIAVDWGTTRLRAHLIGLDGALAASANSEKGVQNVPAGGCADALRECCGVWLTAHPDLPILMAGMVGSRNGWVEAPYAQAPCAAADLAGACVEFELDGHPVRLAPGVDIRWPDGAYDVMRGEETQVLGLGLTAGLVCLPGTHSKWVEVQDGAVARFATFVTGELYAAMTASFIAKLAQTPEASEPGAAFGRAAARMPGGLPRALFQARARVLAGDLPGAGVKPFLSGLLVEAEIAGALSMFPGSRVHLVAGEPQAGVYRDALAGHGVTVELIDPQTAFLAGLRRIFSLGVP